MSMYIKSRKGIMHKTLRDNELINWARKMLYRIALGEYVHLDKTELLELAKLAQFYIDKCVAGLVETGEEYFCLNDLYLKPKTIGKCKVAPESMSLEDQMDYYHDNRDLLFLTTQAFERCVKQRCQEFGGIENPKFEPKFMKTFQYDVEKYIRMIISKTFE